MSEISTEELARGLELLRRLIANGEFAETQTGPHGSLLAEAAARLRALAEDAARLDWIDRTSVSLDFEIAERVVTVWDSKGYQHEYIEPTIRQAIDKARHD